ncbi:MAG: PilZ domain-containing protein [Nitrospirota bacterium]|nr:PilZ domain-containing protein [Nitrospirota bacterium]MDP2383133.1 PilZ domain-containing protein [Nitrospirota bacterium]MDP3598255.1 PilZ domain-containing protein [Nitrospirota bacterium]
MKRALVASGNRLQSVAQAVNRRQSLRTQVEFGLMYSAQDRSGEVIMGDGMVTDLSHQGLSIRGNATVTLGMELTIFLYLPDGQDPLFVMESRVAWTSGRRFGVEVLNMGLREGNRLRHFLRSNLTHSD